jgi:hypothetical protein
MTLRCLRPADRMLAVIFAPVFLYAAAVLALAWWMS